MQAIAEAEAAVSEERRRKRRPAAVVSSPHSHLVSRVLNASDQLARAPAPAAPIDHRARKKRVESNDAGEPEARNRKYLSGPDIRASARSEAQPPPALQRSHSAESADSQSSESISALHIQAQVNAAPNPPPAPSQLQSQPQFVSQAASRTAYNRKERLIALQEQAERYKERVMMARTHGAGGRVFRFPSQSSSGASEPPSDSAAGKLHDLIYSPQPPLSRPPLSVFAEFTKAPLQNSIAALLMQNSAGSNVTAVASNGKPKPRSIGSSMLSPSSGSSFLSP
jgi:hypothetical protein